MTQQLTIGRTIIDRAPQPPQPLPRPLGLIAELTYRCPLHCPYCSNPVGLRNEAELTTDEWARAFNECAALGVLHALLSGGEPLLRNDLPALIAEARQAGLYTNLITSAVGLTQRRAEELADAGLDSVQISFQSDEPASADALAGTTAHALKREAAGIVRRLGLPLTVNVVLHRYNIHRTAQIIAMAEELGASRLELAHVQFYGWGFKNREALLPAREQIEQADRIASAAKRRLAGCTEVLYVLPDYFAGRPKPCMNGWGQRYIAINPIGDVLPCPTAFEIPGLVFDNVRHQKISWIWKNSGVFNAYRGTGWMPEPCKSCEYKEADFGGCRCQAALVAGNPAETDPACALSPHHFLVRDVVEAAGHSPFVSLHMRRNP